MASLHRATVIMSKGTRIVQTVSGSDSDSEIRNENEEIISVNRLTPTVCTDPPEPATTISNCTAKQRTFFAPTGADSRNRIRNLNLPALYAYPNVSAQSQNPNCDCRASKDDCDRNSSDSSSLVTRTRILCDSFQDLVTESTILSRPLKCSLSFRTINLVCPQAKNVYWRVPASGLCTKALPTSTPRS